MPAEADVARTERARIVWQNVRLSSRLAVLAAADIFLGLVYQWYFLRRIGPGSETDAFYAGMMIPSLVLAVLTGSLTQVLVPLLAVHDDEFAQSVWTFVNGVALCLGCLILTAWLGAPWWVPLTVPGFTPAARELTVHLVRVQLLGLVFAAVATVLWTAHQAKERFLWTAVAPLLATTSGLAILVWGLPRFGVSAAAWASVVRSALYTLLLMPGVGKFHLPKWNTRVTREAWRRLTPLLSRSFYFKADVIVDRFLAGLTPAGSLSLLVMARQIYTAGHAVANRAVTAPVVPTLALLADRGEWSEFRRVRTLRVVWATAAAGLLFLALVFLGRPILSLFFARSSFRPEQVEQAWRLLLVLAGVWIAGVTSQVLAAALYAQGDTRTPTRAGVVSFTAGIGLKVAGAYFFGVWGIAAGASLHYLLMVSLLLRAGVRPGYQPVEDSSLPSTEPVTASDS
jgi:putative peptidoglycan lipid II flippase